jgi:hypothetical protein
MVSTFIVENGDLLKIVSLAALATVIVTTCHMLRIDIWSLPPHLVDQCGVDGNVNASAPIVVLGVIASDLLVRRPIPMHSDPRVPLQLRLLKVRVENVLRGELIPRTIPVYYFTWGGGFDGPRPLGFWQVGGRRVFWLRRDSGVLRTVCDGWDGCTMSVRSGAHPGYRTDPGRSINYALADLRLTRGEGAVNEIGFATDVLNGVPAGVRDDALQAYIVRKLLLLARSNQGAVRSSACESLQVVAGDHLDVNQQIAEEAMRAAKCECKKKPDGNIECQ